jgi:beta-mannanase
VKRSYVIVVLATLMITAIAIGVGIEFGSRSQRGSVDASPTASSSPADACAVPRSGATRSGASSETPSSTAAASGPAPAISTARLKLGVAVSGADSTPAAMGAFAQSVGETPSLVMAYFDFEQPPPMARLTALEANDQTMVISWEPWKWGAGPTQPDFRTKNISAGLFDAYLTVWANDLAQWKRRVYLRFGQEMNLTNYPWTDGSNGNAVGDYAAAWRHVHDLFDRAGASNVSWIWSPNVPTHGSEPLSEAYPGRGYVDVLALDGYNWGTTQSWSSWVNPCRLFGPGLAELRALAPGLPLAIAETGCAEQGGDKAAWTTQLVDYLSRQADVSALIMFNQNKEVDWRVGSPPSALRAFADALRLRRGRG